MMISNFEYVNVIRYLRTCGCLEHLCIAQETHLPEDLAVDLTRSICGMIPVTLKPIGRSWAYDQDLSVVLAYTAKNQVKLLSVLHESAHILDYCTRTRSTPHGLSFQRIYARLLRRHVQLA